MQLARMAVYIWSVLMAAALVGQLLRIRHQLARLLAVVMIAWAVNAAVLFALLYAHLQIGDFPPWRDMVTLINALLLAIVPTMLYVWFLRVNGQGDHD